MYNLPKRPRLKINGWYHVGTSMSWTCTSDDLSENWIENETIIYCYYGLSTVVSNSRSKVDLADQLRSQGSGACCLHSSPCSKLPTQSEQTCDHGKDLWELVGRYVSVLAEEVPNHMPYFCSFRVKVMHNITLLLQESYLLKCSIYSFGTVGYSWVTSTCPLSAAANFRDWHLLEDINILGS